MFTKIVVAAFLLVSPAASHAQFATIPTPAEPGAIPLDPALGSANSERWARIGDNEAVFNVTRPTLTPVLPDPAKATGAAVVVAPGGGFMMLSMRNEGWPVARWLADHGIAAFVLKYRLKTTPTDNKALGAYFSAQMRQARSTTGAPPALTHEPAAEDALAALRMVRGGAARWAIDPARVGIIGYSAGAITAMKVALTPDVAARPAFVGYIYGPMDAMRVPADAPPLFAAIAMDDQLFSKGRFDLVEDWRKAKRPIEFHAYEKGGHGFGMGKPGTTTPLMMEEFRLWLESRGLLARRAP